MARYGLDKLIIGGPLDGLVVIKLPEDELRLTPDEARWLSVELRRYAQETETPASYV